MRQHLTCPIYLKVSISSSLSELLDDLSLIRVLWNLTGQRIFRYSHMVGSEWTSPEQKEYLESLLEEYAKIAPTKRYGRFWTQVNETWLRRWPVVQPEPIGEVVFNPSDPNPPQLSLQQRTDKAFALAIDLVLQVSYLFSHKQRPY